MAEKAEQPSEGQPLAKQAKEDKKKAPKKTKLQKQEDLIYLPVLVEFTFASSVIFLILVFLAMAAVSWHTGTSLLDFVLRTSIALSVLGGVLLLISQQVSVGVLSASQAEIEEQAQQSAPKEPETAEQPEKTEEIEKHENVETYAIPEAQ